MEINDETKKMIFECILCNNDVRIEENDRSMMYEPQG